MSSSDPSTPSISIEDPDQSEVHSLLSASDEYVASLYPAESNHMLDVTELKKPEVVFIVARVHGKAVGCGALVIDVRGWGEIKRMFVAPSARGQSIGRLLLNTLEQLARKRGLRRVRLETGVKQHPALRLYHSHGFVVIGPFADYLDDPFSVFMEKSLDKDVSGER